MADKNVVLDVALDVTAGGSFTEGAEEDMNDGLTSTWYGRWSGPSLSAGAAITSIAWFSATKINEIKAYLKLVAGGVSGGSRLYQVALYYSEQWNLIIDVSLGAGDTGDIWVTDSTGWNGVTGMKVITFATGQAIPQAPNAQAAVRIYEMQAWGPQVGGYSCII